MIIQAQILQALGKRLRQRREELGISRAALERQTGISQKAIEKCEAGISAPNFVRFHRLCSALEIPIVEMFSTPPSDDGLGEIP